MRRFFLVLVAGLLALVSSEGRAQVAGPGAAGTAGAQGDNTVTNLQRVELTPPPTWKSSMLTNVQSGVAATYIQFMPASGQAFGVVITLTPLTREQIASLDIKEQLRKSGQIDLAESVEKAVTINEFHSDTASGFYYTVTDKKIAPGKVVPGDYRYLTQGEARVGETLVGFRLVSNDKDGPEKEAVLNMIRKAAITRLR